MGLTDIVKKARERQKLANTAEAKMARARDKVRQAETKAQIEKARTALEIASIARQKAKINAQIAMEKAKTEVERAKTAKLQAGNEAWKARYQKARTATAPLTAVGRVAGKGLAKTAHWLWDEPKPRRKKATSTTRRRRS